MTLCWGKLLLLVVLILGYFIFVYYWMASDLKIMITSFREKMDSDELESKNECGSNWRGTTITYNPWWENVASWHDPLYPLPEKSDYGHLLYYTVVMTLKKHDAIWY